MNQFVPTEIFPCVVENALWIEYERARGKAEAFGSCVEVNPCPPYVSSEREAEEITSELKEAIAYYEGFCDAAITVLEMKVRASEGW